METHEYDQLVRQLSPSRRAVFEALRDHGEMTDVDLTAAVGHHAGGAVRTRRTELMRLGLVHEIGRRPNADGRSGARVFGIVPAHQVEAAAEEAQRRGQSP